MTLLDREGCCGLDWSECSEEEGGASEMLRKMNLILLLFCCSRKENRKEKELTLQSLFSTVWRTSLTFHLSFFFLFLSFLFFSLLFFIFRYLTYELTCSLINWFSVLRTDLRFTNEITLLRTFLFYSRKLWLTKRFSGLQVKFLSSKLFIFTKENSDLKTIFSCLQI